MESRGPVGEAPGGVALGAGSQAPQVEPSDAEGTPEEEVVTEGHRLVGPTPLGTPGVAGVESALEHNSGTEKLREGDWKRKKSGIQNGSKLTTLRDLKFLLFLTQSV